MLCYLTGMEPYYITCNNEGPFQLKTTKGANKLEQKWSNDERRLVNQNQPLNIIIIPCLPDDIIESVIKCATTKDTWTDLVHAHEGPSNTKENRIMDLILEYNTFKAKESESLSQTFTRYKTLLNKLTNDGVKLSKHEIKVGSSSTQSSKPFQTKSKGLVAETYDWDEEEVNILLSMDDDSDWKTFLKYINIDLKYVEEQRLDLLSKYNKLVFELNKCQYQLTQTSSKEKEPENAFIPASIGFDNEMIPKSKDWVKRSNPDTSSEPESSKESISEPHIPLPPLKILHGAPPNLEVTPMVYQPHSLGERSGLGTTNTLTLNLKHLQAKLSVVLEKGIPNHRPILLKESQVDYGPTPFRGLVLFKKKLQNLKKVIQGWVGSNKYDSYALKKYHQKWLSSIDVKIDHGNASEEDYKNRKDSLTFLGVLDRMEARDLAQKAKIKWALEGDENMSFFHGTPNSWVTSEIGSNSPQIKRAVWDCGGDQAPGPDGFTFKFFTSFWDIIEDDVVSNAKFVSDFWPISLIGCQYKIIGKLLANRLSTVIGDCISLVQSAFIKGRNILNGPLILNEVLAWYRQLNGSPMEEFDLFRGLRQGDPMSPFIFILAMEGLHALTYKAKALGLFKGASIGQDNMSISHLMYVDDVIFFGEWSWVNTHNLISMLRCFFLILGLKVNVHKSNVLGVGVTDDEVSHMENIIGCGATKFPLKYSVSGHLSLIKSVLGNLPTFYMSIYLLSISIRKKLESLRNKFFTGGDPDDTKMTWVKWKISLVSKKDGGLGIGISKGVLMLFLIAVSNVALGDLLFPRLIVSNIKWSLDASAGFSVASVLFLVGSYILDTDSEATRWNRNIPIKVNVFLSRLKLNKLPSRVNLDRRGIEVGLILCPSCLDDFETVNHHFSIAEWQNICGLSWLNGGSLISLFVEILWSGMIGLTPCMFPP
ncbi:putative RNA-directed DNA polymerase, eukaryota, reverse transcriptase zinc-binding domain protein, partial [Tanacetum coccineum]